MRKQHPKIFDSRVVNRFLFFPMRLHCITDDELYYTRWFERAKILQTYRLNKGWGNSAWIDLPEEYNKEQ